MSLFQRALKLTSDAEGGKVDHPSDPGGRTNMGVTQLTYDAFRLRWGLSIRDVWDMSIDDRNRVYETYWNDAKCPAVADASEDRVAIAHFDAAIHHGPSRAAKILQEACGAHVDGKIGPNTLNTLLHNDDKLLSRMLSNRRGFMRYLVAVKPNTYKPFIDGWLNRVATLEAALKGDENV